VTRHYRKCSKAADRAQPNTLVAVRPFARNAHLDAVPLWTLLADGDVDDPPKRQHRRTSHGDHYIIRHIQFHLERLRSP
jgi:hypothetical protein